MEKPKAEHVTIGTILGSLSLIMMTMRECAETRIKYVEANKATIAVAEIATAKADSVAIMRAQRDWALKQWRKCQRAAHGNGSPAAVMSADEREVLPQHRGPLAHVGSAVVSGAKWVGKGLLWIVGGG